MAIRIAEIEEDLSTYSEKMLMSVATNYGKYSAEYAQAGGKPRKSSSRRSKTSPSSSESTVVTALNGVNNNGKQSSVVLP
ncbi:MULTISPECIES: hypothetical protein [Calothrix]|uniref:Uncharacterized protein n=2 Tax=Calothrix TaxID=1186 RepID=A0ABR8A3I0_9CYAN|nr:MULTISPECIES: hypothetical protein [Calothrix]MBD2194134.1 hypothetical protein [Calothrix parietina FACHB-288]MBD2229232.1 hypothetical protein [Calothrix anomala FACHB-343]